MANFRILRKKVPISFAIKILKLQPADHFDKEHPHKKLKNYSKKVYRNIESIILEIQKYARTAIGLTPTAKARP